jgi:hypothetical protein
LGIMIDEDNARAEEQTLQPEDPKLIRDLPVISSLFVNPLAVRLKREQEAKARALAIPKYNPSLANAIHARVPGKNSVRWGLLQSHRYPVCGQQKQ